MNKLYRSLLRKLNEAEDSDIYMTFGRMNPCTKGHLKVLKMLNSHPRNYLFVSHSQDQKKNPLFYEEKLDLIDKVAKYNELTNLNIVDSKAKTVFDAIQEVYDKNPDAKSCVLHVICGVDDKSLVTSTLKYNGHPSDKMKEAGTGYQFKDIVPEYSGRDGNSDFDNVSATATRQAAVDGNFDRFVALMPPLKEMDLVAVFHIIQDRLPKPTMSESAMQRVAEEECIDDECYEDDEQTESDDSLDVFMDAIDKTRYNLVDDD